MKLTVYRQSMKTRDNGTIVYNGEDALPFVNDRLFVVADGLGGTGAIYHKSLNHDLFDTEKLMDTLFKGVYDDYSKPEFVKYVTDSFSELFSVKDCYFDSPDNVKKSGYFGSRIVSAILLHEVLYSEKMNPEKLFSDYNAHEDKATFTKALGDYIAATLKEKMGKVAANANLFYESRFNNLALLGTTLCATIYHETDDAVEAFYLTAGDSRPYSWSETDGLRQIIEDEETPNGNMTNCINANEGADFHIRCNYMRFSKPCMLYNASDGCFDSFAFSMSQMAFEKKILEAAATSENTEEMSKKLYDFFLENGRHDDSSTIAMKMFGYDSYEAFRDSAKRRLDRLTAEYLTEIPELLTRDYERDYKDAVSAMPKRMEDMKNKFWNEDAVKKLCAEKMKSERYPKFVTGSQNIDAKIAEQKAIAGDADVKVKSIVARHFSKFGNFIKTKDRDDVEKFSKEYKSESESYLQAVSDQAEAFDIVSAELGSDLSKIKETGLPESFSVFEFLDSKKLSKQVKVLDTLFRFVSSLTDERNRTLDRMFRCKKLYLHKNSELAKAYREELESICKAIGSGKIDVSAVRFDICPEDASALQAEAEKMKQANAAVEKLDKEDRAAAFNEALEAYWSEKCMDIIKAVIPDMSVSIPDSLRAEAKAVISDMESESGDIKAKADRQKELLKAYEKSYSVYLGGVN